MLMYNYVSVHLCACATVPGTELALFHSGTGMGYRVAGAGEGALNTGRLLE